MTENKPTTVVIIIIVLAMLAGVGYLYNISQQQLELERQQAEPQAQTESQPITEQSDQPDEAAAQPVEKLDVDKAQSATKDASADAPAIMITKQEAGQVATDQYDGVVQSIEDDIFQGNPTWEVAIDGSSQGDIEVEVDKQTAEIVSLKKH